MNGYTFWIETRSGERIEWPRLTKADAVRMNKLTDGASDNIKSYGWIDRTEGYAEPLSELVRKKRGLPVPIDPGTRSEGKLRDRYDLYAACEGKDAKTFDEWLNS